MQRCDACGVENRDGAKFCRGCARPLLPIAPGADTSDITSNRAPRCSVCQAIHSRGATVCAACGSPLGAAVTGIPGEIGAEAAPASKRRGAWLWALAVLAVVVAAAMWGAGQRGSAQAGGGTEAMPAATLSATAPLANPTSSTQSAPAETLNAAGPAAANSLEPADKAHFEELVRREEERAEKARQSVARMAAQEKTAREAKERKAAAERQKLETARKVPEQVVASEVNTPKPAVAAVVQAPAPAPVPAARPSVEQACANTANFIERDLCRVDACRDARNVRDPICVWYRRLEEERRNRLNP